ncbi:ATP-binding protein [Lewinella sp. JB7]|uniref:ATP-binding protein n=1 Tax=Lewinella sp. JB7 TaxID=2962887 RepID=UPI0020C9932C|nr:ATP-binding protein [Lewinella sp. JB7]MCP9237972.1 ATP-binding protein [Lewinella sp. JB7]
MINRTITPTIENKIGSGKAIMIIGPRQVGKTTIILDQLKGKDFTFFDGDDPSIRTELDTPNTEKIRRLIGGKKIVFIDEAQRINGIGLTLKIITDQFKDVQLWISGSSSFNLFNELNEPLTGRKWEYELYPISWEEYENHVGYLKAQQSLESRLIYGMYPDVINNENGREKEVLRNLVNSYLYRDILSHGEIRKPEVLEKLVQGLALQVGSEVNYNELSQLVSISKDTVQRYIEILEKGYVIFRLRSFNRNVRNEIKRGRKIYFYDNGIRNAIIGEFGSLDHRQDVGMLWENFLVSERIKQNSYKLTFAKSHFWRTAQQQEIDYVEQNGLKLKAFEFKWNPKAKARFSKTFLNTYEAEGKLINRDNFREFVILEE